MFLSHGCRSFFSLFILFAFSAITACSSSNSTDPLNQQPAVSAKLVKTANDVALEQWLKVELAKSCQYRDFRYYYAAMASIESTGTATAETIVGADAVATSSLQASGNGAADAYSTTNVQEKGVDEGDLVKTDGNYIYLVRGSRFLVLKAQPAEQTAIVSDIDLKEPVSEMHLAGGRVTVITATYIAAPMVSAAKNSIGASGGTGVASSTGKAVGMIYAFIPGVATTRVYNYDVSSPATPVLSSRFDFPGFFQGSRRINDTIYIITNYHIDLKSPVSAWDYLASGSYDRDSYNQAADRASAENLRRINALTLGEMIPSYGRTIYTGGTAGVTSVDPVVASGDIYVPVNGNGTDLSLVIALDNVAATPAVSSSGIISSWCQIYMSPESLYLASSNSWAWIEPVRGVAQPANSYEPWTALHKFALANGVGKPLYKGSGMVAGWLNNQFSMGEYNGNLRIGTTRGGWWGEGISNRLAILAEQDGGLIEKGRIEGLAAGEKIYSMRFDRDRGYMVTFRQTDPLYTFDLSDPNNPKQAGELKVNGFATYIHLAGQDNNRLLTVGRSADNTGRVTGNKLQLFDVSDLAAPVLLGNYELGASWSSALYDYHAFLYYEPLGILAIPYYNYGSATGLYGSGLAIFDVNADSLSRRGIIPAQAISSGFGEYVDTVDRAVIIGTDIYSVAHRSVTVADAVQLEIKRVVGLSEGYGYYALYSQGAGLL